MGIFDKFKKKFDDGQKDDKTDKVSKEKAEAKAKVKADQTKSATVKKEDKVVKTVTDKKEKKKSDVIRGKTAQAYKVLVKPLVTEKASNLGVLNKYVFEIATNMNKIEVKKAIRTIYNVEPVKINIAKFKGKNVRYGRVKGKTKSWKKAIITLKPGDKIEVYEGV